MSIKDDLKRNTLPIALASVGIIGFWGLASLSDIVRVTGTQEPMEAIVQSVTESLSGAITTDTIPDSELYYLVEDSVYDGDTLRVQRNGEELKIRLCGIDAPEKDQQFGIKSRDHLRSLLNQGDGTLIVRPVELDPYGRTVAEIFVPVVGQESKIHLTYQMVMDGYAYHYDQYSGGCPNGQLLAGTEEQARSRRAGVWSNPSAVKPWDYRQNR